jgi:DNA replication licensing factor MCM3
MTSSIDLDMFNENKRLFREYLSSSNSPAASQFRDIVAGKRDRLVLDLLLLDKFQPGLSDLIQAGPTAYLPTFEDALTEAVLNEDSDYLKKHPNGFPRIGYTGVVGSHLVTPRGLTALLAGHLVCVEGIVSRCSASKPRASITAHYVPETGEVRIKEHRDATSIVTDVNSGAGAPAKDEHGNSYVTAHGLSMYRDYQKFTLQEMPENAPTGQMPKSVDVLVTDDMVDIAKPGDRVAVVGVYRPLPNMQGGVTSGVFRFVLVANHVFQLNQQIKAPPITAKDIKNIKQVAARKDAYQLLGRSFAPSISGRDWEKKGLLLQQLGGAEKNLANGAHLRGDVNVLMIGDPSCGKSQLLRFVMNISPLAISTTGRGSTGVGLTAAVSLDKESNEKILEAGAMVLADRGVVCIDEFDKMGVNDRVAIHEVMEQQTVTIAKAGIHTSLNARCSVVAAANPVYGNFDPSKSLNENINLPDSILSRFDLVFIVRDLMEKDDDRRISSQVLRQLRYRHLPPPSVTSQGKTIKDGFGVASSYLEPRQEASLDHNKAKKDLTTEVFDKSLMAMAAAEEAAGNKVNPGDFVSVEFLRKYISYAKSIPAPRLTEKAIDAIAEVYTLLRQQAENSQGNTMNVTPRTLEAIIRLATAHAKLFLKSNVEPVDVAAVHEILMASRGSLTGEALPGGVCFDEEEAEEVENVEATATQSRKRRGIATSTKKSTADENMIPEDENAMSDVENTLGVSPRKKARHTDTRVPFGDSSNIIGGSSSSSSIAPSISPERVGEFTEYCGVVLAAVQDKNVTVSDLFREINKRAAKAGGKRFGEAEANTCLKMLVSQGKVFVSDDVVFNLA